MKVLPKGSFLYTYYSFSNDLCPGKNVKVQDFKKSSHESSHDSFPNTYATATQADLVNHNNFTLLYHH